MTLKKQVATILEEYSYARSDDKFLTLQVWSRYYPEWIEAKSGAAYVYINHFYHLPSSDKISRIRRDLQLEDRKLGIFAIQPSPEMTSQRRRLEIEKREEYRPKTQEEILTNAINNL